MRAALPFLCLATACLGASPTITPAPADAEALAAEYGGFLDDGRTAARAVRAALARAPGFRPIDPLTDEPRVSPGDRLVFVDRDRSAILVVVGKEPLVRAGARMIGSHVDTPAPRLDTYRLTRAGQRQLRAYSYGGLKPYQWLHRPLAVVGQVAARGGRLVDVDLGLAPGAGRAGDDFAFWATELDAKGDLHVITSSTPTEDGPAGPARTLVAELHRRYRLTAADLIAAELYLVPREGARRVGLDRALVGSHGQDDRVNSFVAWRALADLPAPPRRTAMVWLVDREEIGSAGPTGARSAFLELVFAWMLRAEGGRATEAAMGRAFAATTALSADTPACINPNWPEVHEPAHGPRLGGGPAVFPFTGRRGKEGGSAARAELVGALLGTFRRAGVPWQPGQLGRVNEGGGGTIAKELAHRGIDIVDVGVCVVSMHSPFELTAVADLWSAYRGYRAWLGE